MATGFKQLRTFDLSIITEGFLGIIWPSMSGIGWSTRVGGEHQVPVTLEGIFIPLPAVAPEPEYDPLCNRAFMLGASFIDAGSHVGHFLSTDDFLQDWFTPIGNWNEVPKTPEPIVAEAWVPVRVRHHSRVTQKQLRGKPLLEALAHEVVILTYPNSV